nr:PREDICTED: uncharacterized protein LOC109030337 [Bemisia tabaci]
MRLILLNLVVIASFAMLISTVVGQPQPEPEPEVDSEGEEEDDEDEEVDPVQQMAAFRTNLRGYQENDPCRDHLFDEEEESTWRVTDPRARRNCRHALNAFLSLTEEEIDRACPGAQQAKCRRLGRVRFECTFMCRPSLSERNAALAAGRQINRRLKAKFLSHIVPMINRE